LLVEGSGPMAFSYPLAWCANVCGFFLCVCVCVVFLPLPSSRTFPPRAHSDPADDWQVQCVSTKEPERLASTCMWMHCVCVGIDATLVGSSPCGLVSLAKFVRCHVANRQPCHTRGRSPSSLRASSPRLPPACLLSLFAFPFLYTATLSSPRLRRVTLASAMLLPVPLSLWTWSVPSGGAQPCV
jgi:hypothetical protein